MCFLVQLVRHDFSVNPLAGTEPCQQTGCRWVCESVCSLMLWRVSRKYPECWWTVCKGEGQYDRRMWGSLKLPELNLPQCHVLASCPMVGCGGGCAPGLSPGFGLTAVFPLELLRSFCTLLLLTRTSTMLVN